MEKQAKWGNILFYFISATILFFILFQGVDNRKLPVSIWYVYSGSMEPTIHTNDGYILLKAKEYKRNDIITFQPKVLKETYVTHRIVEVTQDGSFITLGDNNQRSDQEFGEPPVTTEQIMGKALMIGNKPLTLPYYGVISIWVNGFVKELNIFLVISAGIILYLIGYIFNNVIGKHKAAKHKRIRLLDIALYLDPVFFAFCLLLFLNAVFIVTTMKSWLPLETSYVVTSTEGTSSPLPGERFIKKMSLENQSLLPYVMILAPERQGTIASPSSFRISPKQNIEYEVSIEAPLVIGYYKEKIAAKAYPAFMASAWIEFLYAKHEILPIVIIFAPGILLNLTLYLWWLRRWKFGRRKVMEWLIPFRAIIKRL